jgi:fibronectin type 3 domain-containing protein
MRRILVVLPMMLAFAACVDLGKPERVADCAHKGTCANGSIDGSADVQVGKDALLRDAPIEDVPAVDGERGDASTMDGEMTDAVTSPVDGLTPDAEGPDAPILQDGPPVSLDSQNDRPSDSRSDVPDAKDAPVRIDVPPGACQVSPGQPSPAGTVCRPAAGACDVAETCDGVSTDCPADKIAAAGKECRAVSGDCDVAETCTGTGVECPDDGVRSAGTVCRPAAGLCDYAEICDGISAGCPVDGLKPSTFTCNVSTGACDPAETCTGLNTGCPQDVAYTAPTSPSAVTAVPGTLSASISWSVVVGATAYNLSRSTVSGGPYATVASGLLAAQSPYTDTGLDSSKVYYYVVTAINTVATCKSGLSPEASVQPTGTCSKPSAPVVTATAGNGQITLNWTAVPGATDGYDIARSEISTTGYASIARVTTGTSYIDPSVQFGKTYYYQVTTLGACNSDPSAEVSASPLCAPVAAAPTGLLANAPNTGAVIGLSWTAVPGATASNKYEIFRKPHSGSTYTMIDEVTSPTTGYSDTTVTNGTSYDYVVTFNNGTCTSAYSNVATVTPACVMTKPVLTASPGNLKVDLSWTAPANGSLTSYKVYRKTTGSYALITTLTGAGSTTYSDTSVANGTTYTYYVTAVGNCTADSDPKTAAPVCTPLGTPVNLKATAGDAQATLNWDAVPGADHYTVSRSTVAGGPYTALTPASPITTNSYTDTGVSNGTAYYYVVSVSNGTCDSANSGEASVTPQTCPSQGAPGTPTLSITASTQVNLLWAAATPTPYGGYNILRSTSATGQFASIGTASASPFTDASPDLTVGTTYYYAVQAIGTACSSTSPSSSIAMACQTPAKPVASIIANSDGTLKVSWATIAGATAYTVARGTSSGGPYTPIASATNITATSFTNTGLTNATSYYYVVTASNANQQCVSAQSDQVSARSCIVPTSPAGVSAKRTGNRQVTLAWTNSTGATSYYIQRSDGTNVRVTAGSPYLDNSATNTSAFSYVLSAASDTGGVCTSGNSTPAASVPACSMLSGPSANSGNFNTTSEKCIVSCDTISQGSWQVGQMGNRTLYVNNTQTASGAALPTPVNGGRAFYFTPSDNSGYSAYINWWNATAATCP